MLTKKMSVLNFESPVTSIRRFPEDSQYCSYLEQLPQELFVHIVSLLPLSDTGNLALTGSAGIRNKIIDWMMSRSFQRKISRMITVPVSSLVAADQVETWKEVTAEFGFLAKKVSMIHGSSYRLRLLSSWYERLEVLVSGPNQAWSKFLVKTGLASALASFTYGWDNMEYDRILGWLRETEEDLGGDSRRLLRLYLWQFLNTDQCRGSWTAWILQTFTKPRMAVPQDYQSARLMICLFGPAKLELETSELLELSHFQEELLTKMTGRPDYRGLEGFQSRSYHYAKAKFGDLGKAFSCLLHSKLISQNLILSIVGSLFNHFIVETDNQGKFCLFPFIIGIISSHPFKEL